MCLHVTAQNVTEYHAAIDGASQKLTEKTERLSLADRDLVQRADEHAEELEKQANQLEEWVLGLWVTNNHSDEKKSKSINHFSKRFYPGYGTETEAHWSLPKI